jgi:hypothetical protein
MAYGRTFDFGGVKVDVRIIQEDASGKVWRVDRKGLPTWESMFRGKEFLSDVAAAQAVKAWVDVVEKRQEDLVRQGYQASDAAWRAMEFASKHMKEDAPRSVRSLLSELGGQTFGRGGRGRDPYWMTAKYAGKAQDGTPFKKGDKVFYYPATKTILAGAAADKAARDFQAAVDDERQYNYGMESTDDAELATLIDGMDEAALDAFAAEIDEGMSPEQRAAKKDYVAKDWKQTQQKASASMGTMRVMSSYSTKALMKMLRGGNAHPELKKDIMLVLKMRMTKGRKTGKLKLRAR